MVWETEGADRGMCNGDWAEGNMHSLIAMSVSGSSVGLDQRGGGFRCGEQLRGTGHVTMSCSQIL